MTAEAHASAAHGPPDSRPGRVRLAASPVADGSLIKTPAEIEAMARAGAAASVALLSALEAVVAGATTGDIDTAARIAIAQAGAEPLFAGYVQGASPPFPAATCISVNDEVVHGIPGPRVLQPGDLVTVDIGLRLDGWCADSARSVVTPAPAGGELSPREKAQAELGEQLIGATRRLLAYAIEQIRPGVMWSRLAMDLERAADDSGFGIVTEYIGHGIGRDLHEAPRAPAYWSGFRGQDFRIQEGMTLAVEPMLTSRRGAGDGIAPDGLPAWRTTIRACADGWTIRTADGSLACHEEHVVAVVGGGCRILTQQPQHSSDALAGSTGPAAARRL